MSNQTNKIRIQELDKVNHKSIVVNHSGMVNLNKSMFKVILKVINLD